MTKVLEWKAGESHENEVFRPEGKHKDRFRLPREQKAGGFGGGPAAYRNTKEGHFYEQERMDRRTALMQAVGDVAVRWIPRHRNGQADTLARGALGLAPKPSTKHHTRTRKKRR